MSDSNNPFSLPEKTKKFLEKISKPLDEEIKKKKHKKIIENDFLLITNRIDFSLEKLYYNISNPKKTDAEKEISFNELINSFLILFSNLVLIFCISAAGWHEMNKLNKEQNKRVNKVLKAIHLLGRKIFPENGKRN